jgi:hypothetical protein
MPKKAEPAKVRKAEKARQEEERQAKAKEDASWADDAKEVLRKKERAVEKLQKAQEAAGRKAEAKALLEEEEAALNRPKTSKTPKPNLFDINIKKSALEQQALAEAERARLALRRVTIQDDLLTENPNTYILEEGEVEARTVHEAIGILSPVGVKPDKQKSLYAQFLDEMTPQIQMENPGLKLSQVHDRVKRAWKRSPRNPLNNK